VVSARRLLVAAWMVLGVLGALNHTVFGRALDLVLPHLRYGHVMFNRNPRTVSVAEYLGPDGTRRTVADLVPTAAPGYQRSRLAIDLMTQPDYLREICLRAFRRSARELTFIIDEYQVDQDPRHPARSQRLRCDAHGLAPL